MRVPNKSTYNECFLRNDLEYGIVGIKEVTDEQAGNIQMLRRVSGE